MTIAPERLKTLLDGSVPRKYITPLFWQHGEDHNILREEIEQMAVIGVNGFIMESRPFPEFLEESWWQTVEFVLNEARQRDLKVYVFDDLRFPSGFAAGRIDRKHLKVYLKENYLDVFGPQTGTSFHLSSWLERDEQLVRVIAVPVSEDGEKLTIDTAIDLTEKIVDNSVLWWDIPTGRHRLFLYIRTRNGGEDATRDYLNPLDNEAVKAYLDAVYEPHYQHFSQHFGQAFAGFFADEPRFGNAPSYSATLGKLPMVIPFSDQLLEHLSRNWGQDFSRQLPCLWHDCGENSSRARFIYMDVVSKLYAENYTRQIGDWCRAHRVKFIGHLVEENGAHARLGYGDGHFFRAIAGQDVSGLDAVLLQILPGFTSGWFLSSCGCHDSSFAYWGLTKMAASAGHLDPAKNGTTMCEAFGAYGWYEGLRLMKWLTDHFCVRGVNHLIPHAFSPLAFPDPDCPPHFYARGHNPQWRYFKIWADYANRICHLLSGGHHVATAAVLYHAEAEWTGGEYEPFEKVVQLLACNQIDCDVVPFDYLLDKQRSGLTDTCQLQIHEETFSVLIVPYAERLPEAGLLQLTEWAAAGLKVIFLRELPSAGVEGTATELLNSLRQHAVTTTYDKLIGLLEQEHNFDLRVENASPDLAFYHYVHDNADIYFLVNGSTVKAIDTRVTIPVMKLLPVGYDAMTNSTYCPGGFVTPRGVTIDLYLEPGESTFFICGAENISTLPAVSRKRLKIVQELTAPWQTGIAEAEIFPDFRPTDLIRGPGNISVPDCLPKFSGTIRYETEFAWSGISPLTRVFFDLGEVFEVAAVTLNGQTAGIRISPPYRFEITHLLQQGINRVRIEVTNTLAKQQGSSIFDRSMPQDPSGLLGPVVIVTCN